jgi:ABC-type transporter Mla maintaining outer membrane lipid asymmetry ATPase subunit MlaF
MRKRDYSKDAIHFTCRAIRELLDQGMADRAVLVRARSSRPETVLAKEPDVRLDT